MSILWAWLGALLIGLSLGLLGSGGSILTVPILVYLVGEPDKVAIAESLGIVGLISLVGALPYAAKRMVDWRSLLFFGLPGVLGTYGGAYLSKWMPGALQLAIFAAVMLLAAVFMARGQEAREPRRQGIWLIAVEGLVVGVVTGLVGVGGGFLIVPALVLLGGLSMHVAVGTSLGIIALKSAAGFYKYLDVLAAQNLAVDWQLVGLFAGLGMVGSMVGSRIATHVPQRALRRGFAVFLVIMGLYILWQTLPGVLGRGG